MFGSKLFTLAVTGISDRNRGIPICERVLTAHSKEGKMDSHVTNTPLKITDVYVTNTILKQN